MKWYDVEFYTAKISAVWTIEAVDHRLPSGALEHARDRLRAFLVGALTGTADEDQARTGDTDIAALGRAVPHCIEDRNAGAASEAQDMFHLTRPMR